MQYSKPKQPEILMDQAALLERKKYDLLWKEFPDYRNFSPADLLAPAFLDFFKDLVKKGDQVIDFGCGAGRSATPLLAAGLHVHLVDFCESSLDPEIFLLTVEPNPNVHFFQECLWNLSEFVKPAEWMICFDVLEHIPEGKVDAVLKATSSRMQKGGFVSISLSEDTSGFAINEPLHLTVKPAAWWREKMHRYFSIFREFGDNEHLVLALLKK